MSAVDLWERAGLPPLAELEGPTWIDAATTVLFLVAAAGAWWLGDTVVGDPSPALDSVRSDPGQPAFMIAVLLAEVVVLVVLYRLYGRAPEWLQRIVRWVLVFIGLTALLWVVYSAYGLWPAVASATLIATTAGLAKVDLSWPIHNGLTLFLGILFAALWGVVLGPLPLVGFLLFLVGYDYVAVSKTRVMFDLVAVVKGWLPVYFVFPRSLRCDLSVLTEDSAEDVPEERRPAGMLGAGDVVLPSALVTSLAIDGVAAVGGVSIGAVAAAVGTVVGLGVARAVGRADDRSIPAIPYIVGGALPLVGAAWLLIDVLPEVV